MSYFDHVRCHACRASLDPEQIGKQGMTCPKCGTALSLTDLFGVKASFAEDDLPDLGLDDLVGAVAQPGADWKPPVAPPKRAPGTAPAGVNPPKNVAPAQNPARRVGGVGAPVESRPIAPPARPAPPAIPPAPPPTSRIAMPQTPAARTAPPVRSIGLNAPVPPPPRDAGVLQRVPKADDPAEADSAEPEPIRPVSPPRRVAGQTSAADLMRALKGKK